MSGLPKPIAPKYVLTLPVSKKKISYRPFMVKEEKLLLIALQTEDPAQMVIALKQIITNCTEGSVDPDTTPLIDIEFLFVNIRAKSVGEILELHINCKECEAEMPYNINLSEIKVASPKKDALKFQLSDEIGIVMKYPSIDMIDEIDMVSEGGENEQEKYNVISKCIDYVYDTETVYYTKDQTPEEIAEFIDSLSMKQLEKLQQFFYDMPQLKETIKFTCIKCQADNEFVLSGFQNFFV